MILQKRKAMSNEYEATGLFFRISDKLLVDCRAVLVGAVVTDIEITRFANVTNLQKELTIGELKGLSVWKSPHPSRQKAIDEKYLIYSTLPGDIHPSDVLTAIWKRAIKDNPNEEQI